MKINSDHLAPWAAYLVVGVGALIMLAPFYFMFVFATHSRTAIFSLPPPLWFGADLVDNLKILTNHLPFWRNLGWIVRLVRKSLPNQIGGGRLKISVRDWVANTNMK